MKNTKKKSAKEKKVLIASLLVAALTVAGSTFAWFTSQDEVTNRLSATADYNVTLTEDFKPQEDITPGQVIKKEVGAVNTGNIDALLRIGFSNDLKYTIVGTGEDASGYASLTTEKKNALVTMSAKERTALQSGGALVYKKDAVCTDVEAVDAETYAPTETGLYIFRHEVKGTSGTTSYKYAGYYFDSTDSGTYYRLVTETETDGTVTPYISGATFTQKSDGEGAITAVSGVKIANTTDASVAANKFTTSLVRLDNGKYFNDADAFATVSDFNTTALTTGQHDYIKVVYQAGASADAAKDLVFYIKLNDSWQTNYTYVADTSANDSKNNGTDHIGYFYYKFTLESDGQTKGDLIDSVVMGPEVKNTAYVALDYDLTAILDSVQVIKNQDGTIGATGADSAVDAWSGDGVTGATVGTKSGNVYPVTWSAS